MARITIRGFLHDLGKIGIPDAILRKPARLDADEYATIRTHPEIGARLGTQFDAALGDHFLALAGGPIDRGRGLLNFMVPYCVSSYSAALNAIRECGGIRDEQERSPDGGHPVGRSGHRHDPS